MWGQYEIRGDIIAKSVRKWYIGKIRKRENNNLKVRCGSQTTICLRNNMISEGINIETGIIDDLVNHFDRICCVCRIPGKICWTWSAGPCEICTIQIWTKGDIKRSAVTNGLAQRIVGKERNRNNSNFVCSIMPGTCVLMGGDLIINSIDSIASINQDLVNGIGWVGCVAWESC